MPISAPIPTITAQFYWARLCLVKAVPWPQELIAPILHNASIPPEPSKLVPGAALHSDPLQTRAASTFDRCHVKLQN